MALFTTAATPVKRGFTLTELAIVLGIMGMILGAVWVAAERVSANNKAQKAAGQVQMILSGYRGLFANKSIDTGAGWVDITCLGVSAGFFPGDMLPTVPCAANGSPVNSTYPSSPWGTAAAGQSVEVRGVQSDNGIAISYYNLSRSACIALANAENSASGLIQSYIGNPAFNTFYPPFNGTGPLTISQINGFCASTDTNEVTFEYTAR